MDEHKKAVDIDNVKSVFDITFTADQSEEKSGEVGSQNQTKADVAIQTDAKPSSAIKLMKHEVVNLHTVEDAEAYRDQLAIAFELLNLKNASLVHMVEYRKMAKW